VRLDRDTVWLTQAQMAELFGRERSVITKHVRGVFREGELEAKSVCANFARTAEDGKKKSRRSKLITSVQFLFGIFRCF
jgi:hypothetical protein